MAGKADMTAAAFVRQYGRRKGSSARAPVERLPLPFLVRLEVDGREVTLPEFVAVHARWCDCLTQKGDL